MNEKNYKTAMIWSRITIANVIVPTTDITKIIGTRVECGKHRAHTSKLLR